MIQLYLILLKSLVTRARLAVLLAVLLAAGGLLDLISYAIRVSDTNAEKDLGQMVTNVTLPLLVPIIALVFASSCLGDLRSDGSLVYIWLRPVPRWHVVLVALAAVLTITLPLSLLPAGLAVLLGGGSTKLLYGVLLAGALGSVAYSSLFIGVGLRVPQALVVGLLYVLVWEASIAGFGKGVGTLSIRQYSTAVFDRIAGLPVPKDALETNLAIGVLLAVTVVGVAISTLVLEHQDVA